MNDAHLDNRSVQAEVPPSEPDYRGLVVIIPSRNRSDLAMRAIRSTLDAAPEDLAWIMVSDNSTDESEIKALEAFCRDLGDSRVQYVRPPEPLKMAMHWDWAFQQALDRYDASHLTVLTDRRVFVRGGIHELSRIARDHPDTVIVSEVDIVFDHISPIRVNAKQGSGRILKVSTETMLNANSRAIIDLVNLVPTPMLAIIPRRVFAQVRDRFGDYCLSIAPDFCFGYRLLDIENSILIYDKSTAIMLNMERSSGFAFMRGINSKDKADFIASNGGSDLTFWAAPVPEILTGINAIYHEYNFVKLHSSSGHFADLDIQSYLGYIYLEIATYFANMELKKKYLDILFDHGFCKPEPIPTSMPGEVADEQKSRRSLVQRLRDIRAREAHKPLWQLVPERVTSKVYWTTMRGFRRVQRNRSIIPLYWKLYKIFGLKLPLWLNDQGFSSVNEAIEYLHGMDSKPSPRVEQILERESRPHS
jgi:glycosyltransferase involved in cell wall biosynthesis